MKYRHFTFLFSIIAHSVFAQYNLVQNPSFEEYNFCPTGISQVGNRSYPHGALVGWYCATKGTPDYFNACGHVSQSVPHNDVGYQAAVEGKAYCGIYAFATNNFHSDLSTYREYLTNRLKKPLEAGKKYCVGFYASPTTEFYGYNAYDMYAVKDLAAYISKDSVFVNDYYTVEDGMALPFIPQIVNTDVILSDTTRWYYITGEFVAQGGEEWITIGNFKNDSQMEDVTLISDGYLNDSPAQSSYYYIDQVTVYDAADAQILPDYLTVCDTKFPHTLAATPGLDAYRWSTGDTLSQTDIPAGGLVAVAASVGGCWVHDSLFVKTQSPPTVDLGPDIENCVGGIEQFPILLENRALVDPNVFAYLWSTSQHGQAINAVQSGTYTLTAQHVCGSISDEVTISGCTFGLYIPNVFAPESTGDNQYFKAFGKNVHVTRLVVYNQWGVLIYQEDNPQQGWDGTFRGKPCLSGVYMWMLDYQYDNESTTSRKYGDLTLIR